MEMGQAASPSRLGLEDVILNTMNAGNLCDCYAVKPTQEWWVLLLPGEREFATAVLLSPATLEQKAERLLSCLFLLIS